MQKNGKRTKFFSWYTLTAALAAAVLSAIGGIWLHGMPLTGLPKAEDVETVTVTRGQQKCKIKIGFSDSL